MKKLLLTLSTLFAFGFLTIAQQNYSKVKIMLDNNGLQQISKLGIDVSEGEYRKGVYLITDLPDRDIEKLNSIGIRTEILIDDLSSFYAKRAAAEMPTSINRDINEDWPVPENWEYGSMGGFYTLEEVMAELDSMATLYPNLVSPRYIVSNDTLTHDGRLMYWVRLSDNPETNEDEPEVLYTGVHHAREPMSVQQMIFYMWHLLENYDTDPDIQILVDNTEMYFVPIVNPDGYEWNYLTYPMGGGMWRKNRRDNGDGTHGVDPNRNYGYKWGYDNSGSSPYPEDETYRGPSAFSEPEIKNMRDFSNAHEFKIALNYHSYSNLLLYPWGWTEEVCPDNDTFHDFAVLMTEENGYTIGPASTTIYPTNGDSNDWMYGEQDSKEKVYAYVPEVGNSNDGFWPSTSRIIPLCQENMHQNITAARLVGKYADINETSPLLTDQIEGEIQYEIKRLGLTDAEQFTVSLTALSDVILSVGENDVFQNMDLMQLEMDSISYTLDAAIENGTEFSFLLSVDNGQFIVSDTIKKIFGTTVIVFSDEGETLDNWTSAKWDVTSEDFHSSSNSITDSKFTNYQNNQNNVIELDTSIDLSNVSMAFIEFWGKWEIEPNWDYVQLMIKKESQTSWTALSGKYTKTGSNEYLNSDEPFYDGFTDWVKEEVDISEHIGEKANLRFILVTDSYEKEDGFYFDDFVVSVISTTTAVNENINNIYISNAYPNPNYDKFNISFNYGSTLSNRELLLFNSFGRIVKQQAFAGNSGNITIDVNNLADGIYFYSLNIDGKQSEVKKLVKLGD